MLRDALALASRGKQTRDAAYEAAARVAKDFIIVVIIINYFLVVIPNINYHSSAAIFIIFYHCK